MAINTYLLLGLILALLLVLYLVIRLCRVRKQLLVIKDALEDLKSGNLNRRVLAQEKEDYIHVAFEKAHRLKDFVTDLFEWVKLDAKERIFHFELLDMNELSRSIVAEWITSFESAGLRYDIEIPEAGCIIQIDSNAYTRILNNLFQNILAHSEASHVLIEVTEEEQWAKITVTDNGKGISSEHLPYIFERMYQVDHSRYAKGNGLGLAIAKELVTAHKGTITASSVPGFETTFTILLPKVL